MALEISPVRVLRRAGMPVDGLEHEGRGATAEQCFRLWNAVAEECSGTAWLVPLAKTSAHGHGTFTPAVFAFSCSPNIEIGLSRLALFKPLVGPIRLAVDRRRDALTMAFSSAEPDLSLPDVMAAFELAYFVELTRICTLEPIAPLSATMPGPVGRYDGLEEHLGILPRRAEEISLTISLEDARRPFLSENRDLWPGFEMELRRQLLERDRSSPMSVRVKSALLEMLPSGRSSADAVSDRLHVSKRSLHRHLRNEGQSFQRVLDSTRSELSLRYLAKPDLSVEEISHLLAFRDPNSFYRAFRNWTGMTPVEARGKSVGN